MNIGHNYGDRKSRPGHSGDHIGGIHHFTVIGHVHVALHFLVATNREYTHHCEDSTALTKIASMPITVRTQDRIDQRACTPL